MARRRHFIAAGLLFGLFFAYSGLNGYLTLKRIFIGGSSGWLSTHDHDRIKVILVRPGGPAGELVRPGDEVMALGGIGVRSIFDIRDFFSKRAPGTPYRLLIRRDGRMHELALRTVPYGLSWTALFILAPALVSTLFLLFGVAVLLLKPDDSRAWLLGLMCSLMIPGDLAFVVADLPALAKVLLLSVPPIATLFWPVFLHFFLVFPEPAPLVRRFPRLIQLIYLPSAILLPILALFFYLYGRDPALAWGFGRSSPWIDWVVRFLPIGYVSAGLVAMVFNYRQSGHAARRKLRVVVVGTLLGFLPLLGLVGLEYFVDIAKLDGRLLMALWCLAFLALLLVPLSFAYAIVRHQVIPIRLIVRQSLRYLLVAKGFFLIEALVLLAALGFLLTGSRAALLDRLGERADIAATLLVSALVLGLLTLTHRRVMPKIDRRFFRSGYDAQKVLADLGVAAREVRGVDDLLDVAAERVQEALEPDSLGVFLLDEASGNYSCVVPRGGGAAVLRPDSGLLTALRRSSAPRETESGGLILPMLTKDDLLGILSLGPRLGDLPYGREDRRLLEAVAWQLAFAIENSRLVRRMVQEERLRRELALASEVQRRLFPEQPPTIGGLDLAGLCYPAQGVGGDYYDFLDLGRGRVGLAVADVAGKGISAALLMSIVQASLRSHASDPDAPLADQVASMNRLLYRSTARNSFASFFYASFDADTRRLVYVNAGHNPPLLLRAGGAEGGAALLLRALMVEGGVAVVAPAPESAAVELLKAGGIVLGATENATYQQQSARLEPGDVLVAYTDGVTEAWSPEGEEFGEERLCAIAQAARGLSAREIADRIVLGVRDWVRDAPQSDDLTLVVAKVG